jgi:hypothetical protein
MVNPCLEIRWLGLTNGALDDIADYQGNEVVFYLLRSLVCFVPRSVRRGRRLSVMIRLRSRAVKLAMYEVIRLREHIWIVHISLFQQSG